jgi:cysteine desulfurase
MPGSFRSTERPKDGSGPVLVSVMLANNETGVIQPVAEIARLAHAHGAVCHTDAIQAVGKIPVDMAALGIDMLTMSAHKIGGPQGVGAIVTAHDDVDLTPMLRGGGQEGGRRAGTENVAGLVGFGIAARAARDGLADFAGLEALRTRLEARIAAELPEALILGQGAPRVPNTVCALLPGVSAQNQVMALDLAGIAVSAGAACSSGKVAPSPVLRAMGLTEAESSEAIRISLGWESRVEDIDAFMEAWRAIAARAGRKVTSAALAA